MCFWWQHLRGHRKYAQSSGRASQKMNIAHEFLHSVDESHMSQCQKSSNWKK